MVLKRPLWGKEAFPVHRVEAGHIICAGYNCRIKSEMVALSRGKQEGILAQEREAVRLANQHLQPQAGLVEGLKAVEVGVLVEDKLESHVCANTGSAHLSSISSLQLQLLHQARELPPSLLTWAVFLLEVLLHVEGAADALVGDGRGEDAAAVDLLAQPVAGLEKVSRGDGGVASKAGKLGVLEEAEQGGESLLK